MIAEVLLLLYFCVVLADIAARMSTDCCSYTAANAEQGLLVCAAQADSRTDLVGDESFHATSCNLIVLTKVGLLQVMGPVQ